MKEKIQKLIADGRTEDALAMLARVDGDAVLLQAQYNNLAKERRWGTVTNQEWNMGLAKINKSILDMAKNQTQEPVIEMTMKYVFYIQETDTPGNELALFNRLFDSLEQMKRDLHYPIGEIGAVVLAIHRHIGVPDLVDAFEDFGKSAYQNNTEAYKARLRADFVDSLLSAKDEFMEAIREIATEKQDTIEWKEAWALLLKEPSHARWNKTRPLIDTRLSDPIFTDAQAAQWATLSADVDEITEGYLWKHRFNQKLPDLKRWVIENLH